MKILFQKIATVLVTVIVCLAVGEAALRLFTPFPVRLGSNRIDHPALGYVVNPALRDIDDQGFRNPPGALDEAEIAVVGDSYTYGISVPPEETYPSVIARKTGRGVYNYGISGYGFYQYKVIFDEILKQDFKNVILGVYAANDFVASCVETQTEYWRSYVARTGIATPKCRGEPARRRTTSGIADAVKYSAINDALRTLVWLKIRDYLLTGEEADTDEVIVMSEGNVLSREYLGRLLSRFLLDDPVIDATFEFSRTFLRESKASFDRKGIRLSVVLIPTKILTLYVLSKEQGVAINPEVARVAKLEENLLARFREILEAESIVYVDALPYLVPALVKSIEAGIPFYPPMDGHPYAAGNEAYADAAIEGLRLVER